MAKRLAEKKYLADNTIAKDDKKTQQVAALVALHEEQRELTEELEAIDRELRRLNCFDDDNGDKITTLHATFHVFNVTISCFQFVTLLQVIIFSVSY